MEWINGKGLLLLAYQRIRCFAFMCYINPRLTLTLTLNIRWYIRPIRFEIESDGRFDSRFDSNAKKRFAGP